MGVQLGFHRPAQAVGLAFQVVDVFQPLLEFLRRPVGQVVAYRFPEQQSRLGKLVEKLVDLALQLLGTPKKGEVFGKFHGYLPLAQP